MSDKPNELAPPTPPPPPTVRVWPVWHRIYGGWQYYTATRDNTGWPRDYRIGDPIEIPVPQRGPEVER